MQFLVIDGGQHSNSLGRCYAAALAAIGHQSKHITPFQDSRETLVARVARRFRPHLNESYRLKKIAKAIRDLRPDVIFVGKGDWLSPEGWRQIKRIKGPSVLWCFNGDHPFDNYGRGSWRPWITASIEYFDVYSSYSHEICNRLRHHGVANVERLPFAQDITDSPSSDIQNGVAAKTQYSPDDDRLRLLFIGNGDQYRAHFLGNLRKQLPNLNATLSVYGRWNQRQKLLLGSAWRGGQLEGQEALQMMRSADLVLNVLRQQNRTSHNMRTFEIPGAGCAMLSQLTAEQDEFFPQNKAALYFSSDDDLGRTVTNLRRSDLCEIRSNALKRAKQNTYRHRAQQMVQFLNNGYKG